MAYTQIHAIKATVDKLIEYICNPDKTDGELYVSSFGCFAHTAYLEFAFANGKNIKNGDNLATIVHNTEFTVDLSPVSNAHSPFFSSFESCQIQGFQERCITWKYASLTVELTVGRIQTFNCIGRVNNLSDIR